jgi:NAD(P)H-dependent FMN reductase
MYVLAYCHLKMMAIIPIMRHVHPNVSTNAANLNSIHASLSLNILSSAPYAFVAVCRIVILVSYQRPAVSLYKLQLDYYKKYSKYGILYIACSFAQKCKIGAIIKLMSVTKELLLMSKILVVIGSARKGRVADKILGYVQEELSNRENVEVTIADLKTINLPFFDNENSPLNPTYTITDQQVQAWSEIVQATDSVIFITPEYNHSMSAIQKNAIDSLGAEWGSKPATAVAYGWSGGSLAVLNLREVLENVKADVKHSIAQLGFMKDISPDGSIIDEANVALQIKTAIDQIA